MISTRHPSRQARYDVMAVVVFAHPTLLIGDCDARIIGIVSVELTRRLGWRLAHRHAGYEVKHTLPCPARRI